MLSTQPTYEELQKRIQDLEKSKCELEEIRKREAHIKSVLLAIRNVNQLIVAENDSHRLIQKACENLTDTMGYFNAWIALFDENDRKVSKTASSGFDGGFISLCERLKRGDFTACMRHSLEKRDIVVVPSPVTECIDCPLAIEYEGRAGLTRRLDHEGRILGILSVSVPPEFAYDTEEQELFEEVACDIAFALHKIEMEKQNRLKDHIIQTISHPLSIVSSDYRYVVLNDAYSQFYGETPEKIVGRPVTHFIGSDVFEREIKPYMDRCLNGETVQHEVQVDFPEKGPCWMRMEYTPYRDKDNQIIGVISHGFDITERKQAEEALRESEEKFSRLFHASPVVMSVTTFDDGVFLDVNESFLRLLGLERAAVIGKSADEIGMWKRSNRQTILHELDRFGFSHNKEVELELPCGKVVPLLWFGDTVKIHGERCIVASGFDLTERISAEEEKIRLEKQLHQSKKMEAIGILAGGIAHEFNNMLSIISGNTEIALEDLDSHHQIVHNLNEISNAAKRSTELTRQLLAFARKQTIAPKVVNLNHIIEAMLKMLEKLIGENIDLEWHAKMDLWPVKVDPSQIDQILANLSVNAKDSIKGTGKLTIETDNVHFDEEYCRDHKGFIPGDFVLIAVSDDGFGMEKETLDNLFDPFFTTKDVGQGTGLGMATVYGIVKQNNGFINVYSELDQGTTFKIYLPRHIEPVSRSGESELPEAVAKGDETILVVEDQQAILRMTKMMLERLGYSVLAASSPAEAIQTAEFHSEDVHMLMTDVVMPDMSGKDLAEKLIRLYPDLKCLFMSGYTANVIAHHGILDEGIHFINKPFSKHDLSIKVREVLDKAKGSTDA